MSEVVEKTHAKLSASGSERWLSCPGSVDLSLRAPPSQSSSYADEGTEAHACLEFFLKNRTRWAHALKKMAEDKWSPDKIEHAKTAVEAIVFRAKDLDCEILCETQVDLGFVGEGMFGTVDAAIVEPFGLLEVFDYKYGAGVAVEPKDNSQMIYYALGLAYKYGFNFQQVKLTIIQPRAEHSQGPIRHHEMSIDELTAWEGTFRSGRKATEDPLAPLVAGDWCRWCPAKAICPEISEAKFREAAIDFAPNETHEIALPVANMIEPVRLSNTLKAIDKLETWIEAVKEHALFVMERGAQIPGFKLVQKRSIRKWKDEEKAARSAKKTFGDEAFTEPELKSPAQLEKALSNEKATVAKFIELNASNESSGVTMVAEKDPRPAVSIAQTDFEQVEDDEWEYKTLTGKGVEVKPKKTTTKKTSKKTTKRKG